MKKIKIITLIIIALTCLIPKLACAQTTTENKDSYIQELINNKSYYILGFMYELDNKYDKALEAYNKALLEPETKDVEYIYNSLGNVYIALGKDQEGLIYYNKAIEQNKEYATPYYNIGRHFYTKNNYPKAIENFQKNIELKGDDSGDSINYIGLIYTKQGLQDKAIDTFQYGISIYKENADLYYNLAEIFKNQENYPLAIENYEKSLKINPTDNEAKMYLSYCLTQNSINLLQKGLINLALQNSNKSINIDKTNPVNYFILGNINSNLKHYDVSIQNYTKSLSLSYDNRNLRALIYDGMGLAYSLQGQTDKAIKYYEYSISLNSKNKDAYHNLGVLYRKKGLHDLSNTYFKQERNISE